MSNENVQEFFSKVKNDPDLHQKVLAAKQGDPQGMAAAMSAFSLEAGVPFTREEFLAAVQQARALTDSDLEGISGGGSGYRCVPCFA